ncbi:peroxiredoxin Q/BCP [Dysgonomonas sp. PH5-45]|uniref:thioredoxin-dependent thiol peroxidase n=1 Tax=unclassified Dysgonomonas TaxID=2630389 RepID=UPI002472F46E|nr:MULTISPECIES: thioredoxin-dependent thiol peroxidase [unclassified Dysgonomonas]MDH6353800.1 peroxiredoxin Q/BCP [Dysgonomonas sp. PH5-45]MDH6386702.1 peroxiredoxin Q/BCP [Dysgonomonas sp. PH5-37]
MALEVGNKIPEILGSDQDGRLIKASDYAGRKFVLYFYPKDSTPGCTAEACSFRDNFYDLKKRGYDILGVSVDNEASHKKFIEKHELPFPLIADTDKKLVQEFGLWAEKTLAGKKYMGTLRTTFLINEEGVIEKIITPKEIKTKEHADQIIDYLDEQAKKQN